MEPHYTDSWLSVYVGDNRSVMASLPEQSVHTVITSPPYYSLRDYGVEGGEWTDGWTGCLGLEPSPDMYVRHLVEVFQGVWRVLRGDGIAWLNLGDTYSTSKMRDTPGDKQLLGIPWRVAFALQDAGWYLRQDIVWAKPNPMPESIEDRPTRSHEFIFMLTKQPSGYFYDYLAVKEPPSESTIKTVTARMKAPVEDREYQHDSATRMGKRSANRVWSDPEAMARLLEGRNRRDVWEVATVAYPDAHYAVFPPKLVEPMVKASTSEGGCCPTCATPFRRKTIEVGKTTMKGGRPHDREYGQKMHGMDSLNGDGMTGDGFSIIQRETVGWEATCDHVSPLKPRPAVVLDPFGGSGTVGLVSQQLSRRAVLIDLNSDYIDQQMKRNAQVGLGL